MGVGLSWVFCHRAPLHLRYSSVTCSLQSQETKLVAYDPVAYYPVAYYNALGVLAVVVVSYLSLLVLEVSEKLAEGLGNT